MHRAQLLMRFQIGDAVRHAGIADIGLGERRRGGQRQGDTALPGGQGRLVGMAFIVARRIGHGRIENDIGRHRTFQRLDRHAHHQALVVRIGEDVLDDDEAALLVGIDQAIGGRQRPAGRVLVDIVDVARRIGVLERRPTVSGDGQLQFTDLGFVDAAVHGLGDDTLRQREPHLGDHTGRGFVRILIIEIGFVRRADALLAGIGPRRGLARAVAGLVAGGEGRIVVLGRHLVDRSGQALSRHRQSDDQRHRADTCRPSRRLRRHTPLQCPWRLFAPFTGKSTHVTDRRVAHPS